MRLSLPARSLLRVLLIAVSAAACVQFARNAAVPVLAQDGGLSATPRTALAPAVYSGDVRHLPPGVPFAKYDRELHPEPSLLKLALTPADGGPVETHRAAQAAAAMPSPLQSFAGLSRGDQCGSPAVQCGNATPPDDNGDVGLNHYIQVVNTAVAIYSKTGSLLANFTFNQLWSGAGTGTRCDNTNQGDPIVLYDPLADRWLLADFAYSVPGGVPTAPFYECIAVSRTSDPVEGGWFLYALRTDDATHVWQNDYPKFGTWPDGIYMSVNGFGAFGFEGTEAWALNRYDLESGLPLRAFVTYIVNGGDPFSMVPSTVRGNTPGSMPPGGTPNYFVSESNFAFQFEVRKYQVNANWTSAVLGAAVNVTHTIYTEPSGVLVPQPNTSNLLDSLGERLMPRVQYRRIGNAESLWVSHSFRSSAAGALGVQWAQLNVSGGAVSTVPMQQQKYDPADGLYRWMSSLATDSAGNVALGYSASSATISPSIRYAGRLAGDPANTLPRSEVVLAAGNGVQNGNCGGGPCNRWGDYSSMSVDPADDCTFWYSNEYYASPTPSNISWNTRIGAFRYDDTQCVSTPATTTNHTVIFEGGVGSDWSAATERLGTAGDAPNSIDYYLTWDSANLYAGFKGISNTAPYTFALVVDSDSANHSNTNAGSMAALACAGGFSENGKGDFALIIGGTSTGGTTKFQGAGGAWTAWSPAGATDAREWGRNMAEFRVAWNDLGINPGSGTVGLYLYVCQGSIMVSAWPPENVYSGNPTLNVETGPRYIESGRTPRDFSQHLGQETQTIENGAGPYTFFNGYARLANISGLAASCAFSVTVWGNAFDFGVRNGVARRTYTLTADPACAGLMADVTLKYEDGSLPNNAPTEIAGLVESDLVLRNLDGSAWASLGGNIDTAANTVTATGVTAFARWGFGNLTQSPTAVHVVKVSAAPESPDAHPLAFIAGVLLAASLALFTHKRHSPI